MRSAVHESVKRDPFCKGAAFEIMQGVSFTKNAPRKTVMTMDTEEFLIYVGHLSLVHRRERFVPYMK